MPITIKEILIKANILKERKKGDEVNASDNPLLGTGRNAIVDEAVDQVLEILEMRKER